jgi:ABC-type uncharacterized transport system ATPase subunit
VADALLNVKNIEVIYDHVILVLKGVSLEVPEGGITALLGANGAGKSTTLKAISNLLRAERGEVTKGRTSGSNCRAASTAAGPSCTTRTSWPHKSRRSTSVSAASSLSSTTSTRLRPPDVPVRLQRFVSGAHSAPPSEGA